MKQYKRGIEAYKAVSTSNAVTTPVMEEKSDTSGLIKKTSSNKFTKVAKLLLLLGKKEASELLSTLTPTEVEKVSMEISKIDRVSKKDALDILNEFGKRETAESRNSGGVETARQMLVNAFGQEKGNEILYKAVPDSADRPFAFLGDLDFNQRMLILRKESNSVLTIVLHHLSPQYSSPIIEALPPEQRKDIILRMANLKKVSPQVMNIISDNLKEKIKQLGTLEGYELDGEGVITEILKYMDRGQEQSILSEIGSYDKNLGKTIQDRLYTVDIIRNIEERDFQKVIQELTDRDLVYLIKGECKEIQDIIWSSMSLGRRALVEEEMNVVGLIKKSDADKMTRDFITILKEKEQAGEIRIGSEDEWIY